jgi:hypothetical protein
MALEHGAFCIGLVLIVLVEKVAPAGNWVGRIMGDSLTRVRDGRWRIRGTWLGDLDSNQDCSVQSREFYR